MKNPHRVKPEISLPNENESISCWNWRLPYEALFGMKAKVGLIMQSLQQDALNNVEKQMQS
jgi:hypothetical protein